MKEKKTFIKLKDQTSLSLSLNYSYAILNHPLELKNNKDPILQLINNYEDILNIMQQDQKGKITKFFYFNKKTVHKILFEKNEVIHLNYNSKNKNLEFYFYLTLLIRENPNILNYEYDEEYLMELNKENQNEINTNKLNKIIKAKFIIELTQEYKLDFDFFDNDKGKELDDIINTNLNIIKNNINIFSDLNINLDINKIILFPIDKIYNEIIFGLIKSKKFDKFKYINDIIKQLDLVEIDITEFMYNNLEEFLNDKKNELIINEYIIKEEKDLNDNLKINFCYFLIKYFYKNDYFISNSKFISSLKENLKNLFNINKNALANIEDNKYKKIRYILDILYLKPKRYIKNNLKPFYDNFITAQGVFEKEKKENENNKDENKKKDSDIEHKELNIIELINQVFNVEEFKNVFIDIMEKEKDYFNKNDLNSLWELLSVNEEENIYRDKFEKILQNFSKNIKSLENIKELNEDLLNDKLFKFYTLDEDETLREIENTVEKNSNIPGNENLATKFEECFEDNK